MPALPGNTAAYSIEIVEQGNVPPIVEIEVVLSFI